MGDYTIISSAGRAIVDLLKREMIPMVIQSEDEIELCCPEDKGNAKLCVYLYSVTECREIAQDNRRYGEHLRSGDSKFLYLYYLITAASSSDIRFRAYEEQNILGKVIEIFNDNTSLEITDYSGHDLPDESGIPVAMINLSEEEVGKLHSALQMKQRLSLFYRVGPVEIESGRFSAVRRVSAGSVRYKEGKRHDR